MTFFPYYPAWRESIHSGFEAQPDLAERRVEGYIGSYDVLSAGQAKARELTLVTHNTTEFQRVPGLKVEENVTEPSRAHSKSPAPAETRKRRRRGRSPYRSSS
jgi:hypothetical protein